MSGALRIIELLVYFCLFTYYLFQIVALHHTSHMYNFRKFSVLVMVFNTEPLCHVCKNL